MKSFSPYFWAILASITWGLSYAIDEKVLKSVSPLALLVVNATITLIFITPILVFSGEGKTFITDVSWTNGGLLLFTSALAVLANLFIFLGIKYLGASSAAVLEISYPFFVILFCAFLWRERPSPTFLLGAALIFGGSLLVARGRG